MIDAVSEVGAYIFSISFHNNCVSFHLFGQLWFVKLTTTELELPGSTIAGSK
jgi:hypothetical protein